MIKPILSLVSAVLATTAGANALPAIIAHRGASYNAPENTMAAFKLAWSEGADGMEADFYLSADGQVVCMHDKTTERTAGVKKNVMDSTFEELSQLDVGAWKDPKFKGEKVPTLGQIIDALPAEKWFFVEIKDGPRIVEPIARILAEKKPDPKKVVLISFSDEVVKACREKIPDYPAYLISSLKEFEKPGKPEEYLKVLEDSKAQGLLFKATAPVNAEWLKQARGGDRVLFAWTVDEPALAKRMSDFGVEFIGSNRPGFLREQLAK